jgi:hypothetical protein
MRKSHLLGFVLSVPISILCIWHGQQSANPSAQLLFVPTAQIK